MFRSGAFVADHVEPATEDQVQPNGVDLTLGGVFEQCEPGRITRNGKTVGDRRVRSTDAHVSDSIASNEGAPSAAGSGEPNGYSLTPGSYVVEYGEVVSIPEGHVGFIYPRSSLLRNSCMLHTAVWDAGYEGRGEGLLEVYHDIVVETGARIGQLVLAEADHEGTYDGSYQGENL